MNVEVLLSRLFKRKVCSRTSSSARFILQHKHEIHKLSIAQEKPLKKLAWRENQFRNLSNTIRNFRPIKEYNEKTKESFYEMFKEPNADHINIQKFIHAIESTGIQPRKDPRMKDFMAGLRNIFRDSVLGEHYDQRLTKDKFMEVISQNLIIITKALKQELVIPDFPEFSQQIEDFYNVCKENKEGQVSEYLPQLARQSPDTWAVSVCTIDGQRLSFGEADVPFTLHSLSKPLTYALALTELGGELVHRYIGQEPSGRNANELVLDDNKKPHNPMISAGAILVGALLQTLCRPEMQLAEKFDFVVNYLKKLSGGEFIGFNNSVFLAEKSAGDRNYALGFYMREHKCYPKGTDLRSLIDFYHQCGSLEGNCQSMSVIAATMANGGVCPLTGDRVLHPDAIRDVLSLMHSCGMYEYSGQFAFKVGLPAKSAAPGTMLVVIPNVMGICTWSPSLDKWNNSCRGVQFFEEIVNVFSFHHYDSPIHAHGSKKDPLKQSFSSKELNIISLLYSASQGDIETLRRHKICGIDMTQTDYDKRTALHLAAAEGHLPCVAFLVDHCQLEIDVKDRWGKTPLEEALAFNRELVVTYLQRKTSTRNTQSQNELPPASREDLDNKDEEEQLK